jgi:hypothetical protein
MEIKTCNKCGIEKEIDDFLRGKNQCKECHKIYMKEYRSKNKDKRKEYYQKIRIKLKELIFNHFVVISIGMLKLISFKL